MCWMESLHIKDLYFAPQERLLMKLGDILECRLVRFQNSVVAVVDLLSIVECSMMALS